MSGTSKLAAAKAQYASKRPAKRLRRRIILLALAFVTTFYLVFQWHSKESGFPRDIILRRPVQQSLGKVSRRYVLFTRPVDSGEMPKTFETYDKMNLATNKTWQAIPSQVYSGLPRYFGQKAVLTNPERFIFAMATDSMHILADDFYPKVYLKDTRITLLIIIGPLDPVEVSVLQKHLDAAGLKSYILKLPEQDTEQRKLELLGCITEFKQYAQGSADYYTILDPDIHTPSVTSYLALVSQYNTIERHLIADTSFAREGSSSPLTITGTLIDKLFETDDTIWKKCLAESKRIPLGVDKISACFAIAQGLPASSRAKFDDEAIMLERRAGDPSGLFESGTICSHAVFYHPWSYETPVPSVPLAPGMTTDELFARYVFREMDEIRWVYTHGYSLVHYPAGLTDRQVEQREVTWTRLPTELPATDAPHRRAKMTSPAEKVVYRVDGVVEHHSIEHAGSPEGRLTWVGISMLSEAKDDRIHIDWVI